MNLHGWQNVLAAEQSAELKIPEHCARTIATAATSRSSRAATRIVVPVCQSWCLPRYHTPQTHADTSVLCLQYIITL